MSSVAALAAALPAPRQPADGDAVGVLPGVRFSLVEGEEQDVLYTASRRSEPRAWLRSVVWLVAAGLHPDTGPSTIVVAEDLKGRMDYRRGIVVYDLKGTARRTGLSVASVKRHVAILRELGALVWLVYGSKRSLALPGEPYMATATIYGAVIPPVYDEAMGHRLSGSGYEGRVCGVTEAGRERAIAESAVRSEARCAGRRRTERSQRSQRSGSGVRRGAGAGRGRGMLPVDNRGVDNSCSGSREPHSPGSYHRSPDADVESGSKDTSQASRRTAASPSNQKKRSSGRPAWQVQRDVTIARQVRPLVGWTQRSGLRQLAFALRPLINEGLDVHTIAAELHAWHLSWHPARPAAYIIAQLRRRALRQAALDHATAPQANTAWVAWREQQHKAAAVLDELLGAAAAPRTDADRRLARQHGIYDPQLVIDAYEDDSDDAFDLYGITLVSRICGGLANRRHVRLGHDHDEHQ
ncbi:cell wall protein [Streptomyces sp. NBC_00654]|uniref:cell wall protein n=1 Tax=Streptomyces sp. NBC_00654 TaxID=2975799 RepID=UPI002250C56A|nr:cell wall protein [Streptomyces sp. NBC_00654]MCX4971033.1 cell wall protein [Streptomyces sp. NBC_00654]